MITSLVAFLSLASAPLVAHEPVVIPGPAAKFDFMNIDAANGFVLACHPGNKALAVLNLKTGNAVDVSLDTEVNGVSANSKGHQVFAAGPGQQLVLIDSKTWKVTERLPLTGPGDCVQYSIKRGVVYVDNDDGTNLWVVAPKPLKLKATVTIHEAPEYMEIDEARGVIYQAIKSTSTVQVVDLKTNLVKAEWKLGELTSPHGLAVDLPAGLIFVAGKNGKLVTLDAKTGKLLGTLDVVTGSDQIAYDAGLKRIYIPGQSKIQVVQVTGTTTAILGSVPVQKDTHRVAIDPKSHDVYVAFNDGTHSNFQRFSLK